MTEFKSLLANATISFGISITAIFAYHEWSGNRHLSGPLFHGEHPIITRDKWKNCETKVFRIANEEFECVLKEYVPQHVTKELGQRAREHDFLP